MRFHLLVSLLFTAGSLFAQETEPLTFDHNAEVVSAQYDGSDNLVITASVNGIVKLWDPETGRLIRSFGSVGPTSKCFAADFSSDGKLVAVINGRGGKVWNTKFGDLVCALSGFSDTIRSIHFSDNSKWLITASMDGTAKLWDVQTGKRHHSLNHLVGSLGKSGQQNGVTDARFCIGESIITGSGSLIRDSRRMEVDSTVSLDVEKSSGRYDSSVLVWDMKTGKVKYAITGYPFDVSPDGSRIVSGSVNVSGLNANVWDANTGNLLLKLSGHHAKVTDCEFGNNGKLIMTLSDGEGIIRIWDGQTGRINCYLESCRPNAGSVARLSPNGKLISILSGDTIRIWSIAWGKLLYSLPSKHMATFSHDSHHVIIPNTNRATAYLAESGNAVLVEKKTIGKGTKKVLKVD